MSSMPCYLCFTCSVVAEPDTPAHAPEMSPAQHPWLLPADVPKEQHVAVPRRQGLCCGFWEHKGPVLHSQSAAGASERALREWGRTLVVNADPVPACWAAGAQRGSLLPGAGPGLTLLPAGIRVALVKGEGEDVGARKLCWSRSDSQPGCLHVGYDMGQKLCGDPDCDACCVNTVKSAFLLGSRGSQKNPSTGVETVSHSVGC